MAERQVLICNAGSTSLKIRLFDMPSESVLLTASVERIGNDNALFQFEAGEREIISARRPILDYEAGIALFIEAAAEANIVLQPDIIGYKTVLADGFFGVHNVDDAVKDAMRAWIDVAPAHNGPYLAVMSRIEAAWPNVPQVAVFETYFHRTIPEASRLYSIPPEWSETYGIKRYGYHGTSHRYVAETLRQRYANASHIISCHLGGSGSVSAILNGESIHNSYGFSLQTGVMHNNCSGQVDTFLFPFLMRRGLTVDEIEQTLAKKSGILGLSGISGDMRDIEEQLDLDPRANLAFDVYVEYLLREIGSAFAVLGGLTDVTFTGGIGENSPLLRAQVISRLSHMGLTLADDKNLEGLEHGRIDNGNIRIHVIAANEELIVAREAYRCQYS